MSREERSVISTLKRRHASIREIARELQRSPSTISDELRRNSVRGSYESAKAQVKAYQRRWRMNTAGKKIALNSKLREYVEEFLYAEQSPEAIAGKLKERQSRLPPVSKNTIYRYIASPYGRRIEAYRKKHKRRRNKPRMKPWKDRVFIDRRPAYINGRRRVGDTEADFIVSGKSGKGRLLVVVDRKLRIAFVERILPETQAEVAKACLHIKARYPEWQSITTDNDILFQDHSPLARLLGIKIYFCFPGHAWEKAQVENTNRGIRRDIPKGSDLSRYSRQQIKKLEKKLNNRIMKTLHYWTPGELLQRYRKRKQRLRAVKK